MAIAGLAITYFCLIAVITLIALWLANGRPAIHF